MSCWNCGQTGHLSYNCESYDDGNDDNDECDTDVNYYDLDDDGKKKVLNLMRFYD